MTYASTSASFVGRTNQAAISRPLRVFRTNKGNVRSIACKLTSEAHKVVETRAEVTGREAFEEMFVASRAKFVAIARAVLRNREDAEDAVQNAFLSGYLHLRNFEGRSALTTWFTRIVLNAALMLRRKRKSFWTSLPPETTADDARWMQNIPASQPDPEMAYSEQETALFIAELLGKMKPKLRQAFTMTYYDELSGREACAILGVSAGTFKARLFRARQQLLNHVQRTVAARIRRTTPSALFPDKNAFQTIVARRPDTPSLEASFS